MDKQSSTIIINYSKCPPCTTLICAGVCPVGIIEQDEKQKPVITDLSSCTKCGVCINLCPSKAITLEQQKQTSEK
jgi:NAD-dependent dihydropyrimidine dehydrogenase PreA subunit